jgi:hypothetical protein
MSGSSDFYMTQAAKCGAEADATVLTNVRDRYLRSQAAWLAMADRLTRAERMRTELAEEKAHRDS